MLGTKPNYLFSLPSVGGMILQKKRGAICSRASHWGCEGSEGVPSCATIFLTDLKCRSTPSFNGIRSVNLELNEIEDEVGSNELWIQCHESKRHASNLWKNNL